MAYNPNDPVSTLSVPSLFRQKGGTTIHYFDPTLKKLGHVRYEDIQNRPQGFDINALPEMNYADVSQRLSEAYGNIDDPELDRSLLTNIGQFLGPKKTFDVTKSLSPVNPMGSVYSVDNQVVSQSPSIQQNLISAGATPDQAATLAAYAQGSGGQAYPQQLLKDIGIIKAPTLNMGAIDSGKGVTIPPSLTGNISNIDSFVSGLGALTGANYSQTALDTERADLTAQLKTALGQSTGQGAAYNATAEQYGLSTNVKQLQSLNLEIAQLQAQYQKTEQALANQPIPTPFIIGQQNELKKTAAIELGAKSALAQAYQGNIELAQSIASKTVEMQFADAEQRINNLKTLLDINQANLSRQDKKQAELLSIALGAQKEQLAQQKQDKKDILSIQLEAAKNGAPVSVTNAIGQATTTQGAIQSAGSYLRDISKDTIQPAPGQPLTISGKPMTEAQATSYGYAQRLAEANQTIIEVGNQFTGTLSYAGQYLPNILKSADRQKFEQAKRNFINAVLRKESGAAISPTEFASAEKQYFPSPGDTDGVLRQKELNRSTVINNLIRSSGAAQKAVGPQDLRTKYNY